MSIAIAVSVEWGNRHMARLGRLLTAWCAGIAAATAMSLMMADLAHAQQVEQQTTPANSQASERKPEALFTIAALEFDPDREGGPLFSRAQAALQLAMQGQDAEFKDQFLPVARQVLHSVSAGTQTRVTPEFLRAVGSSCLGPLFYDEAQGWVQLSYVCSKSPDMPLAKFLSFRDSPELGATLWFEGDRIKEIAMHDAFPVPGRRMMSASAFCWMIANGEKFDHPHNCPAAAAVSPAP